METKDGLTGKRFAANSTVVLSFIVALEFVIMISPFAFVFLVCALQVYVGKLFKSGVAQRGLYTLVRHFQYVALAIAAWGLAVMWPRFLTLRLFAVMIFLYYPLARDEERRMWNRFGGSYGTYLARTGMFLPFALERTLGWRDQPRPPLAEDEAALKNACQTRWPALFAKITPGKEI
jgi:protein-S-isoprenylcysteine O-methyltransferase Ste14